MGINLLIIKLILKLNVVALTNNPPFSRKITMKKQKKYLLPIAILMIIVGLIIFGNTIGSVKYRYGIKFDTKRIEKGIPILGEKAYTSDDWGHGWLYPVKGKGHRYKLFFEDGFSVTSELDGYYSGIKFVDSNGGNGEEYIQITYSYKNEKEGLNPWSAIYYYKDGQRDLTLEKAEEILNNWGVDRLD